jgi:hypothetical protein
VADFFIGLKKTFEKIEAKRLTDIRENNFDENYVELKCKHFKEVTNVFPDG